MQTRVAEGVYLIQGTATKDAEFKIAGPKNTHITNFTLVVGKNKDTTTIFANCKAFGRLADYAQCIKKGDSVLCVGTVEEREWQGKTYKDFNCSWLNCAGGYAAGSERYTETTPPTTNQDSGGSDIPNEDINDDELPF